jgi:hypothetical protein
MEFMAYRTAWTGHTAAYGVRIRVGARESLDAAQPGMAANSAADLLNYTLNRPVLRDIQPVATITKANFLLTAKVAYSSAKEMEYRVPGYS